nr:immunoglobulin heavy chain junction region [Macaca mulatta]MOW32832.1 immunoglobulin heavy chain junction region [Macaca mulatta]MOW33189.1 immunoglobulin heavy chain junction region [Macaca mulatta]MOW33391.1 immunoglobulin heavy chain junction region [Macaca mulatta]MOW33417.1 immunoglobulin heavy chain junction region [Macaca mulatta]
CAKGDSSSLYWSFDFW